MKHPVLLALIGAPHGIKGEVRVTSHTENPLSLADYRPLRDSQGNLFKINNIRPSKNIVVVKFKGVNSRKDAEALFGIELFVDRQSLPNDTGDNEFYVEDLIGMDVQDVRETSIGTIMTVPDFGAGSLLEIAPKPEGGIIGNKTWYLEFTRENVPEVNFEKSFIRINPPTEVSERDGNED